MKAIGLMVFSVVMLALFCWQYYFFLKISVGTWLPKYAKRHWVELAESQTFQWWFWKWVSPIWVVTTTLTLFFSVIKFALE
jgi:hypothetical protein